MSKPVKQVEKGNKNIQNKNKGDAKPKPNKPNQENKPKSANKSNPPSKPKPENKPNPEKKPNNPNPANKPQSGKKPNTDNNKPNQNNKKKANPSDKKNNADKKPNVNKKRLSHNRGPPGDNFKPVFSFKNASQTMSNLQDKYSRRKIQTNFVREELPEDIYDKMEETSRAINVHELFNKPVSIGEHFQFKLEKLWDSEVHQVNENDLFTLDFEKLSAHIVCVPFHELIQLDESMFPAEQIEESKRAARENKIKHERAAPSKSAFENLISQAASLSVTEDSTVRADTGPSVDVQSLVEFETEKPTVKRNEPMIVFSDEELDDLLKSEKSDIVEMISNQTDPESMKVDPEKETNSDLEDWLDEYLGT